jgi:peptidoglycan hydrolase CwlO-like protein
MENKPNNVLLFSEMLENDFQRINDRIDELESENADLKNGIRKLERTLRDVEWRLGEIKELGDRNDRLRRELRETEQELRVKDESLRRDLYETEQGLISRFRAMNDASTSFSLFLSVLFSGVTCIALVLSQTDSARSK